MKKLSDFPDELICDILAYLNAYEAIHAFFNINKRFDQLLDPFKEQIDLTRLSYEDMMIYIHQYLPSITQCKPLRSIKLGNQYTPGQIDLFNTLIGNQYYRQYLKKIDQVIIESVRFNELTSFVNSFLLSLPQLEILSLKIDYIRDEQIPDLKKIIIESILSISTLRKLSINLPHSLELSRLPANTMLNGLIDLRLNLSLVTDLLILVARIPNVENLSIRISWWTSADRTLAKMLDETGKNPNVKISTLPRLKNFHLIIDSILSFDFGDLEKVLKRVMNQDRTQNFRFTLRNCLNYNDQLSYLTNGEKWENLLLNFPSLNNFHLYIRILSKEVDREEIFRFETFKSKFFLERQWFFSFVTSSNPPYFVLYTVSSKQDELFELKIENDSSLDSLSTTYASNISIDKTNSNEIPLDRFSFEKIFEKFPIAQELRLVCCSIDFSRMKPLYLSSLYRLKIDKEKNGDLLNVLKFLPLINTLSICFSPYFYLNSSFDQNQYEEITDLSLNSVSTDGFHKVLEFLTKFPNLHHLHIHIANRRVTNEQLLTNLNKIVVQSRYLISLKLQLEKDALETVNWLTTTNGRMKMYLRDTIFDGVLIHFWF